MFSLLMRSHLPLAALLLALGCDGETQTGSSSPSDPPPDTDGDGLADVVDNCPDLANTDQIDLDLDGLGDLCDDLVDTDLDGIVDDIDNCRILSNADQLDSDVDLVGDLCDNCPADSNADQLDDDLDGVGNACPCDVCSPGQWCSLHPDPEAYPTLCLDGCPEEHQGNNGICCPLGSRWSDSAQACLLADIYADEGRLRDSLEITFKEIEPGSCELYEGCVGAAGVRRLLRFDTTTPNVGEGDMYLGRPEDNDNIFLFSECHNHYHFDTYADYQLLDTDGNVVAPGHKQAFCLLDFEPWEAGMTWLDAQYYCGNQGITAGFADTYGRDLDCQYIDITDVSPGDYTLRITLNYAHMLAEADYENNITEVEVSIPAP